MILGDIEMQLELHPLKIEPTMTFQRWCIFNRFYDSQTRIVFRIITKSFMLMDLDEIHMPEFVQTSGAIILGEINECPKMPYLSMLKKVK